jgi:ketosteroid isomerase-like protein
MMGFATLYLSYGTFVMTPTAAERDALFQGFARALFRNDMDALYKVVTPNFVWRYHDGLSTERVLTARDAIGKHIEERKAFFSASRFHDVAYHHLPDISFMTFRVSETVRATGEQREQQGIERYTFDGGKLATKDVYRKPIAG